MILNCSSAWWLTAFSSSSSEKVGTPLFHSQHPSHEVPGQEDPGALMTPLRAANWKPCVMHKSVTPTEIYKDRRIRALQQANQRHVTLQSFRLNSSLNLLMRMSIRYILSPHNAICHLEYLLSLFIWNKSFYNAQGLWGVCVFLWTPQRDGGNRV